jgi:sec-independent protein translocase protein TatB
MFDIGFWELVLVAVVALLAFGPERLPKVAREAALWIRKFRALAASAKAEIDQELQLQELRESLMEEQRKLQLDTSALTRKRLSMLLDRDSKNKTIDAPREPGEASED